MFSLQQIAKILHARVSHICKMFSPMIWSLATRYPLQTDERMDRWTNDDNHAISLTITSVRVANKKQKMNKCKTSGIAVAYGRPLNDEVPGANNKDFEQPSIVINKRLHNTWRFNVSKPRLIEYDCHLKTQHNNHRYSYYLHRFI